MSGTWRRLIVLVIVVGTAYLAWHWSGFSAHLEPEVLAHRLRGAGVLGVGLFVLAFCVGELTHVPGVLFVAVAMAVYGRPTGTVVAIIGATAATMVTFAAVRIGGRVVTGGPPPQFFERFAPRLERHGIPTVMVLRLFLFLTPAVTWALALSPVRTSQYVIGTVLGLAPVIFVLGYLMEAFALQAGQYTGRSMLILVSVAVLVGLIIARRAARPRAPRGLP